MKECNIKNIGRLLNTEEVKWFIYSYFFETKINAIDFIECIKTNGIIKFLKTNNLYKQIGARKTKKTFINEDLERFIILKNNAQEYANSIINFTDLHLYNSQIKYQRNENAYLELIEKVLTGVCDVEYQYVILDYRIDMYIPKYKIAIEFDEKYHSETKTKKDEDIKRQIEIENAINCTFYRIDETKDVLNQIDCILKSVIKKITKYEPNITGRFITDKCLDTILGVVNDFDKYFIERNLAATGKDCLLSISFHDKIKIENIEEKMAFAIDMGYITSFDMLLQELRKLWKQHNKAINMH